MPGDVLIDALVGVVGPANVLIDGDLRAGYETDWTGRFHGSARRVVRPANTDEVGACCGRVRPRPRRLSPKGVTRGSSGGVSLARRANVVMSMRRLHPVGPVDAEHGEVVVEAGAVLNAVRAGARRRGLGCRRRHGVARRRQRSAAW